VWSPLVIFTLQICNTQILYLCITHFSSDDASELRPVKKSSPSLLPKWGTTNNYQHTVHAGWMDGWMVCGQETLFHCIPHVWQLIMVVTNLLPIHMFLSTYLVGTKCLNYLPTSVFLVRFVI
jgi:hypothetical protein